MSPITKLLKIRCFTYNDVTHMLQQSNAYRSRTKTTLAWYLAKLNPLQSISIQFIWFGENMVKVCTNYIAQCNFKNWRSKTVSWANFFLWWNSLSPLLSFLVILFLRGRRSWGPGSFLRSWLQLRNHIADLH